MTDHANLTMHREHCRVSDREMVDAILRMNDICSVAFHDEPYPYVIQMNYGYDWEGEKLVLYMHLGMEGHKLDLVRADPRVAVTSGVYLSRLGHKKFRKEPHDYRSVTGYGTASIINANDDEAAWVHGFNRLLDRNGWPQVRSATEKNKGRLQVMRVDCDIYTAKAQYAVESMDVIEMPSVEDVDAGIPYDPFLNPEG